MRVLHVSKTSEGAPWAAALAAGLVRKGIDVHVALPRATGASVPMWEAAGAQVHIADLDFPVTRPCQVGRVVSLARELVGYCKPDLIHSHFFGPTVVLRRALGKGHPTPRIFQVAGPLHLEHTIYRNWDLWTAGPLDYWIPSSRCILNHYLKSGTANEKLYLSYHGGAYTPVSEVRTGIFRQRYGIPDSALVVGNINMMYPPKRFLGQTVGLKCHEDVIDALGLVLKRRPDVIGLLVGGPWGDAPWYEQKLRARARRAGGDSIIMPGAVPHREVEQGWADFDCAVHVPLSENCGGVVESLLAGVPTIGGDVGGVPEIIHDGLTGKLVPVRKPTVLAEAIESVLADLGRYRKMATRGRCLVKALVDPVRTCDEVFRIYEHILTHKGAPPASFDPAAAVAGCPDPFANEDAGPRVAAESSLTD